MENREITVLLVGVGGYGASYVNEFVNNPDYNVRIVGAVDLNPSKESELLREKFGISLHKSMEDFYRENRADLCIISTPIHLHKPQTILALENGSHVLCEKPDAGCVEDALAMLSAQQRTGKLLNIGFQIAFSDAVLNFKRDIISGVWGAPKCFKSLTLYPRPITYFSDRRWAGRKYGADGSCIMDSVASNATAHALQAMLFLAGSEMHVSAEARECDSTLIRVNDIETFDAVSAAFYLENGVTVYYNAAHPVQKATGHTFEFIFEKGTVKWGFGEALEGTFADGTVKTYGVAGGFSEKIAKTLNAIRQNDTRPVCGIYASLPHTKAVGMLNSRIDTIERTKGELTIMNGKEGLYLPGLDDMLINCFNDGKILEKI